MKCKILLMVTALLTACGGGGGDDSAVSASSPAPSPSPAVSPDVTTPAPAGSPGGTAPGAATPGPSPAPGTSLPPVDSTTPTSAAPTPPVAGAVAHGGVYGPQALTCAQGHPAYWARTWTVRYNGTEALSAGKLYLDGADGGHQELSLPWATVSDQPWQDGTTFGGVASDGRQAWVTVNGQGVIAGAGYQGTDPADQLRCGVSLEGVASAGPVDQVLQCANYTGNPGDPLSTVQVRIDATDFPWRSLAFTAGAVEPIWTVTGSDDGRGASVIVYSGGQNTGWRYELRDGRVASLHSPRSRNGGPPLDCEAP